MPKPVKFAYRFKIRHSIAFGDEYTVYKNYIFPMIAWAKENLKPNTWRYYGEYTETPFEMCFQNKKDAAEFDIRFNARYEEFRYLKLDF